MHVGTKIFDSVSPDRCPACPYRLAQDGLPFLLPYLSTKRVVTVPKAAFVAALVLGSLDLDLADALLEGEEEGDGSAAKAKAEIEALELGAFVVRMDPKAAVGGEEAEAKGAYVGVSWVSWVPCVRVCIESSVGAGRWLAGPFPSFECMHAACNTTHNNTERGPASFAVVAWKGFGSRPRLMCQASDLFLYRCRLQACGLATAEELAGYAAAAPQAEGEKEKEKEGAEKEEEAGVMEEEGA